MKDFDEQSSAEEVREGAAGRKQRWYEQPDVPLWRLRLRVLMQRGEISVKKLSDASGLSERAIHGLLEGVQTLRFDDLARLAKGVRVSPAYLGYGVDGKAPIEKHERARLMRETMKMPAQVQRKWQRSGLRATPDVSEARRQSLRRLIEKRPAGMTLNQVGALLGFTRGVIYRLVDAEDPSGFGNLLARRVEARMGLDEGDLQISLTDDKIDRAWRFATSSAATAAISTVDASRVPGTCA